MLIRLKGDIPLRRTSPILADGSCLAELSGDGVTVAVRVIEYFTDVEGQEGPETALREAKAALRGGGPGDRADAPADGHHRLSGQETEAFFADPGPGPGLALIRAAPRTRRPRGISRTACGSGSRRSSGP